MEQQGCIRGNYNFHLQTVDNKTILYKDLSDWMAEYPTPISYSIEITHMATGKKMPAEVRVDSNVPLPLGEIIQDGIYEFYTNSCGVPYWRKRGLFPNLDCCITRAYAMAEPKFRSQIKEIEQCLRMVDIAIELNDMQKATDLFSIVQDKKALIDCYCKC